MSKDNMNENRYIGTFTILNEEIDGEIIHNKKTGTIFLNLAKMCIRDSRYSGHIRRLPYAGCPGNAISASAKRERRTRGKILYLPPGRTHLPGRRYHRRLFL